MAGYGGFLPLKSCGLNPAAVPATGPFCACCGRLHALRQAVYFHFGANSGLLASMREAAAFLLVFGAGPALARDGAMTGLRFDYIYSLQERVSLP